MKVKILESHFQSQIVSGSNLVNIKIVDPVKKLSKQDIFRFKKKTFRK